MLAAIAPVNAAVMLIPVPLAVMSLPLIVPPAAAARAMPVPVPLELVRPHIQARRAAAGDGRVLLAGGNGVVIDRDAACAAADDNCRRGAGDVVIDKLDRRSAAERDAGSRDRVAIEATWLAPVSVTPPLR